MSETTRPARRIPYEALAPIAAVLLALVAGGVMIALVGQSPFEVYGLLVRQALGTGYGFGQTLFKATPLVFAGLSVALAFRAGLFNVGVEGQMYLGGFAAALVGAYVHLPALLLLPAALLAAALAGGAWGAIPGILKARFGAHEVINTIMLNFIAFALVSWWGRTLFVPATVRTVEIAPAAQIRTAGRAAAVVERLAGQLRAGARNPVGTRTRRVPVPHPSRLRAARAGPEPGRGGIRRRAHRTRADRGVRARRRHRRAWAA